MPRTPGDRRPRDTRDVAVVDRQAHREQARRQTGKAVPDGPRSPPGSRSTRMPRYRPRWGDTPLLRGTPCNLGRRIRPQHERAKTPREWARSRTWRSGGMSSARSKIGEARRPAPALLEGAASERAEFWRTAGSRTRRSRADRTARHVAHGFRAGRSALELPRKPSAYRPGDLPSRRPLGVPGLRESPPARAWTNRRIEWCRIAGIVVLALSSPRVREEPAASRPPACPESRSSRTR